MAKKPKLKKTIDTLTHEEASRKNIPTAEHQSVMSKDEQAPQPVSYPRDNDELQDEKQQRNRDLDPQLVWRGKDEQDCPIWWCMRRHSISRRKFTPRY